MRPHWPKRRKALIEWISSWAGGIIVAVIIGTIIEMILPEGNSKKYIKVVIGIYVLFTIISPVITKFTGKSIEVSNMLSLDEYIEEAERSTEIQNVIQNSNANSILSIYSEEIKKDMVAKIKSRGYEVNNIEVEIADDESYSILSIDVDVSNLNKEREENNVEGYVDTNEQEDNTMQSTVEPVENVNKIEINIEKEEKNKKGDSSESKTNNEDNERREHIK